MPVFNKMVYNGTEYILGGGGNIGEPLNLTVTTSGLDATITWEDNEIGTIPPTTFQKSELVRKIGSAPTSPSDGDLVVTETVKDTYKTTGYVDQGLTDGETYYYRVFSYSDLGGISYCDAVSVTPSAGGWQPGANTLVYMPIDTSDTSSIVYDHSTNGNDFNWYGTANYDTLASGKRVLSFGGSNGIYVDTNLITAQPITINIWLKRNGTQADSAGVFTSQKRYGGSFLLDGGAYNQGNTLTFNVGGAGIFNKPYNDNTWYNVVGVLDNGEVSLYFNGQLQGTQSVTVNLSSDANSFGFTRNNGERTNYRFFNGWMSAMIIEDKAWTLQEIQDYFDQTKGDYGIS